MSPLFDTNITEADWQATVVEAAHLFGWRTMHVRRAIGGRGKQGWVTATSVKGWPDLTLWHPLDGGVMFVELKSEAGKTTAEQDEVLASLRLAGLEAHVWRPSDWPQVERRLRAGGGGAGVAA